MNLWIRSQDRTKIIKSSYLSLFLSDTNWFIYTDTNTGEPFNIGKYKTKERAIEVLDEIQEHLEKIGKDEILTDKMGIINGIKHYGIVYEMPEE